METQQVTEKRPERQVAFIVQLSDILGQQYIQQQGWLPDYVVSPWGEHIVRVNIVGTVVDRTERQIILDDGTGTVPLRCFEEVPHFMEIKVGDCCVCIGKARKYNDEMYILAESIQLVSSNFVYARQQHLLLFKTYRERKKQENHERTLDTIEKQEDIAEEKTAVHPVLNYIEQKDTGAGVEIQQIIKNNGEDAKRQVDMLLMNGDIFEIRPGIVKVLK